MEQSGEEAVADGFVGKLTRPTRSGGRLWPAEVKGRAVFESMKPGARVCEVARRYGVKAQQLTTWRRLARAGRLALVTDDAADFVQARSLRIFGMPRRQRGAKKIGNCYRRMLQRNR